MAGKEEEIQEIKNFLKYLKNTPQGEVIFSESPDCIIENKIKLGIEHTRLYQPETEDGIIIQEQEAKRDAILRLSEEFYDRSDNKEKLRVTLCFSDSYRINIKGSEFAKREVDELPNAIFEIVDANIPDLNQKIELNVLDGVDLPDGLSSICIWNAGEVYGSHWTRIKGGTLPYLTKEIVQKTIYSHNDKVESYLKNCEEVWLVIVENNFLFERSLSFSDTTRCLSEEYDFNFNKAFLYRNKSNQIFELHC